MPEVEIRAMTAAELDLAVEWAAREGWNPGLDDAACFRAADPGGFLMAFVDGEPAATISVVNYGAAFGFLGFYICRPDLRGQGIGWRLWQAGMARHGDRVVGLDGVVDQQDNYRKSGFVLAHRNIRHSGIPAVEAPDDPRLAAIGPDMLKAVIAYDRPFFPAPREAFLHCWLGGARAGATRTGWALLEDGRLAGYGVIRASRDGAKIGPLFADDAARAEVLFRRLAASMPGVTVALDTPEPNADAVALAVRHGLAPSFETARMYRGLAPQLPLSRLFGITTFELG